MNSNQTPHPAWTRRHFFSRTTLGVGTAALASLLPPELTAGSVDGGSGKSGLPGLPHFAPRAKRVIFLYQSGGPSQLDLFDYKPRLQELRGTELPASIRMGQRITGMTSQQAQLPVVPSLFRFARHGQSGTWASELLPHTARVVDDLLVVKTVHTEAINHDPAMTFIQTGSQQPGRPSMGAWLSYGLGSENESLPSFVVLVSKGENRAMQPIMSRMWGSAFLPSSHQGVKFRGGGDPVLYLSNPPGINTATRRRMMDGIGELNRIRMDSLGDPEIASRISQYEMAFRMQASVPELTDVSREPERTFDLYGPDSRTPGTYAANCLLARRLTEKGVRFVQLFHRGWDQHLNLPSAIREQCTATDQASAALVTDLKQRGLLEETLVIWGGEFGRTVYCQGQLTEDNYGRDHHPRCFTMWMAGGGMKAGTVYGETDDFGYNVARDPVHVHDFQATVLHALGIDHTRLTFKFQGRHHRLTDIHGRVVEDFLA